MTCGHQILTSAAILSPIVACFWSPVGRPSRKPGLLPGAQLPLLPRADVRLIHPIKVATASDLDLSLALTLRGCELHGSHPLLLRLG
jgi:hypothetical protein